MIELILFPSFCRLCHRLLDQPGERVICHQCWHQINQPSSPYCQICGRFMERRQGADICTDCQQTKWSFSLHRSCFRYEGLIKEIILLYKYGRFRILGRDLANLILLFLVDNSIWDGLEVVVPVPLQARRQKERGFNQAEVIARYIGKTKGLPIASRAIIKIKDTPPQASLEAKLRRENVKGAYKIGQKDKIRNKIVLLVDDVFTTGSTIEECSRILKEAGAREIRAITVAQA